MLFEADDHNVAGGRSVVLRGTAQVLEHLRRGRGGPARRSLPVIATQKLRFVRVTPETLTGRRFVFGPEPEGGALVS